MRASVPSCASSSSRRFGAIVSRSQPASSVISPRLRKLAPMTSVLWPKLLEVVVDLRDRDDAGILGAAGSSRLLGHFLYQSRIRPTNGEISVTPASAHAMAWCMPKSSVRLQWMPSFSSTSAARMPSQVEAILMRTRSRRDAGRLVLRDEVAALLDRRLRVERQPRVDLGRDAARDDLQDAQAELDREPVDREPDDLARVAARLASSPSASALVDDRRRTPASARPP